MKKVWVLQHAPCESPGILAEVLTGAGVLCHSVRTFEGEAVPQEMDTAAGLVLMGGPMGVYDRDHYPFLSEEIRLIERALEEDKPILGVCLGSQLMAAALGAAVTQGKKEIGWHTVALSQEGIADPLWKGVVPSFMAYHWHGDVFELPRDAVSLASSASTACQAFRYGHNAYGILFHLEVTWKIVAAMVKTFGAELRAAGLDGEEIITRAPSLLPQLESIGKLVFRRWSGLLREP